ncbi:hypothetical protein GCM10020221_03280 [Streptomyces thioluteus]|uniref:Secreted protein n=1 Tax=Streptomyces thioluteus TaxID=66431 RepID=A0ABP6IV57_STRTU
MPVKQSTTVALTLCGSLALGLAGAAIAVEPLAAPKPRPAVAPNVTARLGLLGSLGNTLTLGTGIVRDAQAARPDLARLKILQRQLADEGARLHAAARAEARQTPANPKNKKKDPVSDLQAALDTLSKDATKLLNDLAAGNLTAVVADVTQVLADLTKVTTLVTQVGSSLPVPTPPLPVPLPVPVGQ